MHIAALWCEEPGLVDIEPWTATQKVADLKHSHHVVAIADIAREHMRPMNREEKGVDQDRPEYRNCKRHADRACRAHFTALHFHTLWQQQFNQATR